MPKVSTKTGLAALEKAAAKRATERYVLRLYITGMTPLHVAAMFGRRAAAEWLLDHGAAVNAVDAFGDTPLHTAAVFGRGHTVTLLAARGAALDARNHDGLTPRELAVRERHERVAALLERLEAGG